MNPGGIVGGGGERREREREGDKTNGEKIRGSEKEVKRAREKKRGYAN